MPTVRRPGSLSRRAALRGASVTSGLALLATASAPASAQATSTTFADHPLAGTWAVSTLTDIVPQTHAADGNIIAAFPANYVDPDLGLTFQGTALGRWEPTSDRGGRFTILQALSDAAGAFVGTFQLSAAMLASDDGQTWEADGPARIILRDATNATLVDFIAPDSVTGSPSAVRITPAPEPLPLLPLAGATDAATPTS